MTKKGNVVAIVQARMSSKRLPKKSMLDLHGHPVIEWVFRRARKARLLDYLVFAIPRSKQDDPLNDFLEGLGANVFRGDEFDLVDRFYFSAKKWKAAYIVRICADCPFISGSEIDCLVEFFMARELDYAYNNIPENNCYPDGLGAEMVSSVVLEKLYLEVEDPSDREHVTSYIRKNSNTFAIGTFDPADQRLQHPELRLDLDDLQDYERLLKMNVSIEMEAHEIIKAARGLI
jgi:spore coat polysaccharide biosynthesis protein SpsF